MSAASFSLAAAVRRCLSGNPSRPATHLHSSITPFFLVERQAITTEALPSCPSTVEDSSPEEDGLKARIFRLRLPKRSAMAALERWVGEGKKVTASELRGIARDLRRAQRYKHALEILTWMESHSCFSVSAHDCTLKLDLIFEVHGLSDAEAYYQMIRESTAL